MAIPSVLYHWFLASQHQHHKNGLGNQFYTESTASSYIFLYQLLERTDLYHNGTSPTLNALVHGENTLSA